MDTEIMIIGSLNKMELAIAGREEGSFLQLIYGLQG